MCLLAQLASLASHIVIDMGQMLAPLSTPDCSRRGTPDSAQSCRLYGVSLDLLQTVLRAAGSVESLSGSSPDRAVVCSVQEKLAYHRRSRKQLSPGLYLGYLKLCTSMDQIRALVPQKLPNVLCHTKIRDNANVSRWPQLNQTLSIFRSMERWRYIMRAV